MSEHSYTATEVAKELGISAKDFRRFLRTQTDQRAGKGGSWVIDEETKDELIRRYNEKPARGTAVTPILRDQGTAD